ncbi:MAG: hypothetical protein Kow00109_11510 [Acidobacteriota bacterium]
MNGFELGFGAGPYENCKKQKYEEDDTAKRHSFPLSDDLAEITGLLFDILSLSLSLMSSPICIAAAAGTMGDSPGRHGSRSCARGAEEVRIKELGVFSFQGRVAQIG